MAALNGGLADSQDCPILDSAADVSCGENHAFWFFDDKGRYSLLNYHIHFGDVLRMRNVPAEEIGAPIVWSAYLCLFIHAKWESVSRSLCRVNSDVHTEGHPEAAITADMGGI